jgi:UDP-N-acetylglucosamine 3-dehydrogenase
LRIGLVGAGYWGSNIARAIIDKKLGDLVAIHDMYFEKAYELAKKYDSKPYKDLDQMLEKEDLDAVIVAVSADNLYRVAKKVIEEGINVFIEKPVATSLEEIEDLRKRSEVKGVVAVPGFIMRFDPVAIYIKDYLEKMSQDPVYIYIQRSGRRAVRYRNISIILDLGVHDIDLLIYLLKNKERLKVIDACISHVADDESYITYIDYEVGTAMLSSNSAPLVKIRKIFVNLDEKILLEGDFVLSEVRVVENKKILQQKILSSSEEPLVAELKAFIDKINGKDSSSPDLRDAEKVHKIIKEIFLASRSRDKSRECI